MTKLADTLTTEQNVKLDAHTVRLHVRHGDQPNAGCFVASDHAGRQAVGSSPRLAVEGLEKLTHAPD